MQTANQKEGCKGAKAIRAAFGVHPGIPGSPRESQQEKAPAVCVSAAASVDAALPLLLFAAVCPVAVAAVLLLLSSLAAAPVMVATDLKS